MTEHPKPNTWLFSGDDVLNRLPSRKQMLLSQILKVYELIYDFLVRLASVLKLDGRTILAATIYIHRFYMRMPITTSKYFVACAAVAISCKLHDTYRPPDKIALTGCQIKHPGKQVDQHSSTFWSWRDQLLHREEVILKNLNFEVSVDLPYEITEELLKQQPKDPKGNGFYEKLPDILKITTSKIELLSALPVLVVFDIYTLYGAMLILTVKEAKQKFDDIDAINLPEGYLDTIGVTADECFECYQFVLKLRSLCEDPQLPSHRIVVKKITDIGRDAFYSIANGH